MRGDVTTPTQSVSPSHTNASSRALHDPALIMGTLPNGMRYYIRANSFPAKRANLWLAVNAGSINEDEDQRGFAHFLEHMAFNGTTHFPGNSLIDFVEQSGMTFGGDLNASTSFEETIYKLTIPTDDKKIVANGLQVLDDWANGRILMDSAEVVAERGVVLGEWRVRLPDTASQRFQRESYMRIYGDSSLFAKRLPIGDPELLKTATSAPIMRFYRDWYRPDLMAVIAVGDFDPNAIEKEILRRFRTAQSPPQERKFEPPVVSPSSETIVYSLIDRVRPQVELTWPAIPLSDNPELALRQQLIDELTVPYLRRTFTALSKRERRPFAWVGIGRVGGVTQRSQDRMTLRLVAAPDSLMRAFRAALTEVERVAQHGITDDVLAREKQELLRRYQAGADGSAAISSSTYVQEYVQQFLRGRGDLLGPGQQFAIATRLLPTISSRDIAHNLQGWRSDVGRIVTVSEPLFAPVPKILVSDVKDLLRDVAAESLTTTSPADGLLGSPTAITSTSQSLVNTLPQAGTVVSTQHYATADVTVWTLSNGARVVYKRNASQPDDLLLNAYSLGGHSLLPDSLFASPGRLVGMLMTASGGFGGTDHDAFLQQARTTGLRNFKVELNTFDEQIVIGGSPRDVDYLFQLLYLQFTNPTVDTLGLADWRRNGFGSLSMSTNDQYAYRASGNRRLMGPSPAQVPFIDLAQAKRVYQDRFGDASDFTFYLAGPSKASEILPLVTQYIASLPSTHRTQREVPRDFYIPLPKQKVRQKGVNFRLPSEKAGMSLTFGGAMPKDSIKFLDGMQDLSTASWILGRRLRIVLREKMGVTYSVGAPYVQYWTPDPRYSVAINVTTDPHMLDTTVAVVLSTVDQLRKQGPTDEELAMANEIQLRKRETANQSNRWWINRLEVLDRIGLSYDNLEHAQRSAPLTKERIRAAAETYFSEKTYVLESAKPPAKKKTDVEKDKDGTEISK